MKFVTRCRFLKIDVLKSKENKEYATVALLDDENNSYKFFVFDDLKNRLLSSGLNELQFIDCAFEAAMYDKDWRVRLLDFKKADK